MTTFVVAGEINRPASGTRAARPGRAGSRTRPARARAVIAAPRGRRHPAAPVGRPAGAPAPALRCGPAAPAGVIPSVAGAPGVGASLVGASTVAAAPQRVAAPRRPGWRLTDRGIAVVLALFAVLMVASLVTVVDKALTVTSPDSGYAATR